MANFESGDTHFVWLKTVQKHGGLEVPDAYEAMVTPGYEQSVLVVFVDFEAVDPAFVTGVLLEYLRLEVKTEDLG